MIKKILVANRGEIARRIFLACRELNVASVAIYSDADADAAWLHLADERVALAGDTAVSTYLNQEKILAIAEQCGVDAIHPGYGFLSENHTFATHCAQRGIKFIGPTPEAMRLMGSKASAREIAQRAGVPIVPGVDGAGLSVAELQTAVSHIPFPMLIKASAGGGGKGMRVVWQKEDFADGVQAAQQEAQSAFGDDHILVEQYFTEIHHVEIQILADEHGHVLHLFERECSIQRRHQKIIEESPAPIIQGEQLRQQMAEAAVSLATSVNYSNAGTVEFIVDAHGNFYFLEMNTRLQVEHPITELVTGIDLAVWQIRIAAGEVLSLKQTEISQRGHAIECRIYAEDPANHFLPSIGEITVYKRPLGNGVRVDDGIAAGTQVSPYYDPMLAKIITWGHDRAEAIRKMRQALQDTAVLGVTTNLTYLAAILQEETFLSGKTATNYLETHFADWQSNMEVSEEEWLGTAVFEFLHGGGKDRHNKVTLTENRPLDPWQTVTHWRNV